MMPDIQKIFLSRWKFILSFTIAAVVITFVIGLFLPKKYLSTVTALPANSLLADKGRLFNSNIQALYSEFGTPDELDRVEGTAALDTIYLGVAQIFDLPSHYKLTGGDKLFKASLVLRKNSKVFRSAYGELKIKVWDEDRNLAADLANALLHQLQIIHQNLQLDVNKSVLENLEKELKMKKIKMASLPDSAATQSASNIPVRMIEQQALLADISKTENLMLEYRLALQTNPPTLLIVESARAAIYPDKPKTLEFAAFAAIAAFAFSFILAAFMQGRKASA